MDNNFSFTQKTKQLSESFTSLDEKPENMIELVFLKDSLVELIDSAQYLYSILLLVNNHLLFSKVPEVYLPLMKLAYFKTIRSNSTQENENLFIQISNYLLQNNIVDCQKSLVLLKVLAYCSNVISSDFYLDKEKNYSKLIKNILNSFLLDEKISISRKISMEEKDSSQSDFSPFVPNIKLINMEVLNNIEKELVYYQACYAKNLLISNFDLFIKCSSIRFDINNMFVNNIIIDEFCMPLYLNFINYSIPTRIYSNNHLTNPSTTTTSVNTIKVKPNDIDESNLKQNQLFKIVNEEKIEDKFKNNKLKKVKNVKLTIFQGIKFKTIKRENIDKKIIRKYRKYIFNKLKHSEIEKESLLFKFCNGIAIPPFSYEGVSFKSMNTSYLIWLLSHETITCYYEEFIKVNYTKLLNLFLQRFNIKDNEEIEFLKSYLTNFTRAYTEINLS